MPCDSCSARAAPGSRTRRGHAPQHPRGCLREVRRVRRHLPARGGPGAGCTARYGCPSRRRPSLRRFRFATANHARVRRRLCGRNRRGDRMTSIDLNSDLGENVADRIVSDDASMLRLVTSANVSCGFHAGSPEGIRQTLAAAVEGGVVIGAHPGYRDYENFGRTPPRPRLGTLQAHVEYQLGALMGSPPRWAGRSPTSQAAWRALQRHRPRREAVEGRGGGDPRDRPEPGAAGLSGGVVLDVAERAGLAVAARGLRRSGLSARRAARVAHRGGCRAARPGRGGGADGSPRRRRSDPGDRRHGRARGGAVDLRARRQPGSVAMAAETKRMLQDAGITIAPFAGSR